MPSVSCLPQHDYVSPFPFSGSSVPADPLCRCNSSLRNSSLCYVWAAGGQGSFTYPLPGQSGRRWGLQGLTTRLRALLTSFLPSGCHHSPSCTPGRRHTADPKPRSRHHQTARAGPSYILPALACATLCPWPPPPATPPSQLWSSHTLSLLPPRRQPSASPSCSTSVPPAAFSAPLVTPWWPWCSLTVQFPYPIYLPLRGTPDACRGLLPLPPAPHLRPCPAAPSPPHRPNSPLLQLKMQLPLQLNLLQLRGALRGEGCSGREALGQCWSPLPTRETVEPEARLVSSDSPVPPAPRPLGAPTQLSPPGPPLSTLPHCPPGCPQRMGSWGGRPQL